LLGFFVVFPYPVTNCQGLSNLLGLLAVGLNELETALMYTVNSEDLFQPQNAKLALRPPGADQPTVELFQPQLG